MNVVVTGMSDLYTWTTFNNSFDRLSNFETAILTIRILGEDLNPIEGQGSLRDNNTIPGTLRQHNHATSEQHLTRGRHNSKPLRTSRRLRNLKQTAKHVAIQKLSTIKDIKIEVSD